MKKIILILITILCIQNIYAQDSTASQKPTRISINVSMLNWAYNEISNYYGPMTLFGVAAEKKLSEDFSCELSFIFGKDQKDDFLLQNSQTGISVKYAWYALGASRPNVFGKFGVKYLILKETGDGEIETGNSIGFSLGCGIEIPLSQKTFITGGWDSVYSTMEFYDENVNVGSHVFYVGLIFNL